MTISRVLFHARPLFYSHWPLALRMRAQMDVRDIERSFHIMPDLGIVYLSIPKAACTTLKLTFHKLYGVETEGLGFHDIHDASKQPWQHISEFGLARLAGMIEDGSLRPVTFVRDPFSRALSVYRNQFEFPMRGWRKARRIKLRSQLLDDPMRRLSFAEFLDAVARQKSRWMNEHWRPQTELMMSQDISYSFVGHQENLEGDLLALGGLVGRDFSLSGIHSMNRSGAGDALARYYTPETADMVRHIYAADFRILGYSTEQPGNEPSAAPHPSLKAAIMNEAAS